MQAWCEEIGYLTPEQLVLGGAARTIHRWFLEAGVKRGDTKGDKMVQAGREVQFKIKNAYFQEVLQGQQLSPAQCAKDGEEFVPNKWTKVGQDRSAPVRTLPASRQVATDGTAKNAQSKKYVSVSSQRTQSSTLNQALNLPPKVQKPKEASVMVNKKAQRWLWMNRENMWLEWVLAAPPVEGSAQHASMHTELAEVTTQPSLANCSACGAKRKAGSGGWGDIQLCAKCHKATPGLREVLQLKCVTVLAEMARQLWGSKGHKVARSLAAWKRVGEVLQGDKGELWRKVVDATRQVGGFRPQALLPTEWSTIWHQFPCRLRVYATQIAQAWDAGSPEEYGVGPAELHALQDMAAKWWQDVHATRPPAGPRRGGRQGPT